MKLPIIPSKLKKFWDEWDLRVLIIASLSLQTFLLLLAPSRQRSRSKLLFGAVWTTYLLADWVAAVSIGQITKTIGDSNNNKSNSNSNSQLYAVWASFLLVHLGGPDGITSLSLEDNELWLRHLFGLFIQSLSAFYGLYLTLAYSTLYGLNLLVFLAGNIKFGERTWALYSASLSNFGAATLPEPNPGPDYEDAMAEHAFNKTAFPSGEGRLGGGGTGVTAAMFGNESDDPKESNSKEMKMMDVAYSQFSTFKGLLVGFLISSKDRDLTRTYFLRVEPLQAFRLVEYELSFVYQVLHTKSILVYSVTGCVLRALSFFAMLGASLYFHFLKNKRFGRFETSLTYALFFGAVALETYSILKLLISDWTLMALKDYTRVIRHVPSWYLKRSRWSGSVSQRNAIGFCLSPAVLSRELWRSFRRHGVVGTFWMKLQNASYSERVSDPEKKFIVEELKKKSRSASGAGAAAEACSQRGNSALLQNPSSYIKLNWSIGEYQYVESVLLWHLATQLCLHHYEGDNIDCDNLCFLLIWLWCGNQSSDENDGNSDNKDGNSNNNDGNSENSDYNAGNSNNNDGNSENSDNNAGNSNNNDGNSENSDNNAGRRFSKMMSEYLFYLLIDKPEMLAPVLGNWNVVFQDTCAEAKRHFEKHGVRLHWKACEKIISVDPKVRSAEIKGNRSTSVLFDAGILAKQLMKESERWEIMSRVWVELLSYAAINCRPFLHTQQLSKGGELLTFVWLLMNQLGLGTQFAEQEQRFGTRMVTIA